MAQSRRSLPPPRAGFRKDADAAPSYQAVLRQARKSGQLNLSNRQFSEGSL